MLRRLAVVAMLALTTMATDAMASHDTSVEIQFWAFSRDGNHMLVIVKDEARGDVLAIKQVAKFASVYEQPLPPDIEPEQLPLYLQYPPFNKYGFVDPGTIGETSPDGFMLMATPTGPQLTVFMAHGERMLKLFGIPLGKDPTTGQHAKAEFKEVRWSASGKSVAIIVHQGLETAYGMNVDQLVSFDPTPYKKKLAAQAPPAPPK